MRRNALTKYLTFDGVSDVAGRIWVRISRWTTLFEFVKVHETNGNTTWFFWQSSEFSGSISLILNSVNFISAVHSRVPRDPPFASHFFYPVIGHVFLISL